MTNKLNENLFIELGVNIAPGEFKRNIIVQNTPDVIQEHRKKYNNTDVFRTVFQYDSAEIRNANQQGALYFDLDGETAQEDAKTLFEFLLRQACPELSIRLYYSGNKGFHIEIPFETLSIQPNRQLNVFFGRIAKNIKEQ